MPPETRIAARSIRQSQLEEPEQPGAFEFPDMKKRLLELFGLLLIGDGILTVADPKRHCLLWEVGPKALRDLANEFVQHPTLSRMAGLAETIFGLLLAERQKPDLGASRR